MSSKKKQTVVERKFDNFILQCPNPRCGKTFPVCINSPLATGISYGLENAPLFAVAEVNHGSRIDTVHCCHCGMSVYLEVCYTVRTRCLSDREREDFQEVHSWKIA